MADTDVVIQTSGLTREFAPGVGAIDVDLCVSRGEIYGFLGPNGAGKSTTLRMLTGVARPDRGSVRVLGHDPWSTPGLMRRVGVLHSETAFARHHTGATQLELIGRIRGLASFVPRGTELAEEFELDLDRKAHQLSLGNRQKLGLVLALAHEPEVLILDEPTGGLDPLMQRRIDEHLRTVAARGTAVLLSSHSLPQVERIATQVGFIRDARMVDQDRLSALRLHARQRAVMTFDDRADPRWFDGLGATAETKQPGAATLEVSWSGPAAPVLAVASGHGLATIETARADIEETFLSMYAQPDANQGALT